MTVFAVEALQYATTEAVIPAAKAVNTYAIKPTMQYMGKQSLYLH